MKAVSHQPSAASEQDFAQRVLRMLNLELVRDAENVARVISSRPTAERQASAILPANLPTTKPAGGPCFSSVGPENNPPLSERVGHAAVCAVAPAEVFSTKGKA